MGDGDVADQREAFEEGCAGPVLGPDEGHQPVEGHRVGPAWAGSPQDVGYLWVGCFDGLVGLASAVGADVGHDGGSLGPLGLQAFATAAGQVLREVM